MLKNISSIYMTKKLLMLLPERKKLELIKYNKNLQLNLKINLIDFRRFSCRYIKIDKKDGKVKEYNSFNDILLYEGEYLNGKRNGQGKEYNIIGNIIFEGEYLNGKRWNGRGKEFNDKNEITYIGGYINGKKGGKGTEYKNEFDKIQNSPIDRVIFEGEYLNGEKNGHGKEYSGGDLVFEGEFINGQRNGKGIEYYGNHKVFEGEYIDGQKCGNGEEYDTCGRLIFKGKYLFNHKKSGKKYINKCLEFDGEYLFDRKWTGEGYDDNGNKIYELSNGTGYIREYNENNKLIYEGEYYDGRRNGKGKEYNDKNDELLFEGEYLHGKRWNGQKYKCKNNELIIDEEYINGEIIKK